MQDAILDQMIDAAAILAIKGEPVSVRRVADESGLSVGQVWRRWGRLDQYDVQPVACGQGYGLGEKDDDEVQYRVTLVREAKAKLPRLEGVDPEVLDEILTYDERTLEMAKQAKQYDRSSDDWSIGCSDEDDRTPTRLAWTPDGRTRREPIRDGRRRYVTGRQYACGQSRPTPLKAVKERPVLTLAQQAVRDYRRAWRRIAG
jgi:hypothetical protein